MGLPERLSPNEKLFESKRGHRTLINKDDSILRKMEKRYDDECEDDDKSESSGCDQCSAGAVTVATMAAGYVAYRCLRMVPSVVIPLLWPTIPANLFVP